MLKTFKLYHYRAEHQVLPDYMKKILLPFVISFFTIGLLNAQFSKIGGGISYGSGVYYHNVHQPKYKTGNTAITLKGVFGLSLPVHISPSLTYFIPSTISEGPVMKYDMSAFLFDLNGHFVFNSLSRFEFYGLAGLNISLLKYTEIEDLGEVNFLKTNYTETFPGLNLGAGTNMKLTNQLYLTVEAGYILNRRDQLKITAGLMLNLDWLRKHETRAF